MKRYRTILKTNISNNNSIKIEDAAPTIWYRIRRYTDYAFLLAAF